MGYPGWDHRQGGEDFKKGGVETFFVIKARRRHFSRKKIGGGDLFFEKNTFEIFENNLRGEEFLLQMFIGL